MQEKYTTLVVDGITLWYPKDLALLQANCTIDLQGWWIFQELIVVGMPATVREI